MKKLYIIYFLALLTFSKNKYVSDEEISKLKYIPIESSIKTKVINKGKNEKKEENKKNDDVYISTVKVFNIEAKDVVSSLSGINNTKIKNIENSIIISGKKNEVFNILELGVDIDALKEKGEIIIKSTPALNIVEGSDGEIKITSEMILGLNKKKEEKYTNYEAGMIIKINPRIRKRSFNEYIDLQIYTEMSNFKLFGNDRGKEKNVFNTNVMVKNNGSIFIGGLNERNIKKSEDGVKYLSDIPVFGNLFKRRNTTKEKRDIYIEVEASIEE